MTDTTISNITSVALSLQTLQGPAGAAAGTGTALSGPGSVDEPYDAAGAAVFVVIVVTLYGLSIVLLLAFHVKGYDNSEDSQIDKYLKLQPAIRRQAEKDSFIHLRNQIGVRLFVRKFHAWLESTDDECEELRTIEVDATNRRPTFDHKLQRYVDVPIKEEEEEEENDAMDGNETSHGNERQHADAEDNIADHEIHQLDFEDPWIERRTRSYVHQYAYEDDVTTADDEDSYNYDYEALEATEDDSVYGTKACIPDEEYEETDLYLNDDYLNDELYASNDEYDCDCQDPYDDSGRFQNDAFSASNSNSYDDRNFYLNDVTRTARYDEYYRYESEVGEVDKLLDGDDVSLTTRITAV